MTLLTSFRSEILKTKRTSTVALCLLVAALTPFVILMDYSSGESAPDTDPWYGLLLHDGLQGTTMLVLPLYLILLCTLLPQVEFRNNTWKQVLASPQPTLIIFFAKFLNVQLFIILFLLFYQFLMVSISLPIEMLYPGANFSQFPVPWLSLFMATAKIYIATLGISAFLFWTGFHFRNFVTPLGVGLAFWLLTMLLIFEIKIGVGDKLPFAFPPMVIFPKFDDKVPMLLLLSLGYMILFLTIAYFDFRRFKMK